MHFRTHGRTLTLTLAILASACGSGSGSPTVTIKGRALKWAVLSGQSVTTVSEEISLLGGKGSYFVSVVFDRDGVLAADLFTTGTSTASLNFAPVDLSAGRREGTATISVCQDLRCTSVIWSKTLPYSVTVFAIDPPTLVLTGLEGADSAPVAVTVTPPDTNRELALRADGPTGATEWLRATRVSSTQFDVTAKATALQAGHHQGELWITINDVMAGTMSVGLDVGSGLLAPPAQSISLRQTTTLAETSGSLPVSVADGARAWTAQSDRAWLVLHGAAGAGAGTLDYTIDLAQAAALPNWSTDSATITFKATGLTDATTRFTLGLELPLVTRVTSPVLAGRAATIRVQGRGLSQLSGTAAIQIGGLAGLPGQIDPEGAATMQLPPLAAGSYAVTVPNALGLPTTSGTVSVMAPGAMTPATVAHTGYKNGAVFDVTRQAIFATDTDSSTLVRYSVAGGTWRIDAAPLPGIRGLALAPDARTLYVTSCEVDQPYLGPWVHEVDPDSLTVVAQHRGPDSFYDLCSRGALAITSDDRLWLTGSTWVLAASFDTSTKAFVEHRSEVTGLQTLLMAPRYYASADGSRMVMAEMVGSPPSPARFYTTATGAITRPAGEPPIRNLVSLDAGGALAVVDGTDVYRTADWSIVGQPTEVTTDTLSDAVLSPDGSRVYRVVKGPYLNTVPRVDVFDVTAVVPGSTSLVKVGEIPITGASSTCAQYSSACHPWLLVSPLGDTLFLVSSEYLTVLPIPVELSGL
jgi:hypothetical protein